MEDSIFMNFYIDAGRPDSVKNISEALKSCIFHHETSWSEIVFLCIGTDRITGDCLGPWVGQLLSPHIPSDFFVYGTLSFPVHALNLVDTWNYIQHRHPKGLIIAVDASLGQKKHLGYVTIANGSLHPGAAVHKNLPPVGHITITGIVNTASVLRHFALQTTRLSTVIILADQIAQGILPLFSQKYFIQTL